MRSIWKPAVNAGLEEVTQRLKTEAFLRSLHAHLKPEGLVAFNLIERDPSTPSDIDGIRAAFPSTYLFDVPESGNLVIIGTLNETSLTKERLFSGARELEGLLPIGLPFERFVKSLR